ncbi:probable leucine-rich repeat receptor-like serine/threonine-protein kinase [Tanacetum coccineum]
MRTSGILVEKDFDISDEAGGAGKVIVKNYTVNVMTTLEIRLYWAGKGTINIPKRGVYGPLISAISVNPNFWVPPKDGSMQGNGNGVSVGTVVGIVVGAICVGVLQDGTLIVVKQLSSKSKQGNKEFLNKLGVISALQHPNLVKLHGCCIQGNQLLLAYEYMENNSLARALFGIFPIVFIGPKEWRLELDWPTRYMICIDIVRGLAFLPEESRIKIVHKDIKATNILLDKNINAKISDFGLVKLDEEDDWSQNWDV